MRELGQRAVERRGWGVDRDRRHNGDRRFRRRGRRQDPIGQTQCSDGIDNDGDGKIDYADPECVGGLDNDESSYATGIPGDNVDACKQDCFFDGNSGMGDDGCMWQLKCDPRTTNAACPYDQAYATQHADECSLSSSQSQTCIDKCQKLVPNGCDCFGCCAVPGAPTPIRLVATCTAKDFGDPDEVPALHAGHAVHDPVRALRLLHRQGDAARRLHHRRRHALQLPDRLHRVRTAVRHRPDDVPDRHDLRDGLLPADRSLIFPDDRSIERPAFSEERFNVQ